MILHIIFAFIFIFSSQAEESMQSNQPSQKELSNLQSMTSFAKNALITSANLAKKEFNMEDESAPVKVEDKFKTSAYKDIFFTTNESALISQALDYYKQGKRMYSNEPQKQYNKPEKVEKVRKPLIKLSSIMYTSKNSWAVFTSIGKFSNQNSTVNDIEITGVSKDEAEFTTTIEASEIKPEKSDRVFIEGDKLIVTLRTGECIFEEDLKITKNCRIITEMVDKEIDGK